MFDSCFADEIAIDFPDVEPAVKRMCDVFLGEQQGFAGDAVVRRELLVSRREVWDRLVVPIVVPIRGLCRRCGGRGEVWTEPCAECRGSGALHRHHAVQVALSPGVASGARFRFRIFSPGAEAVHVEVRITITDRVVD